MHCNVIGHLQSMNRAARLLSGRSDEDRYNRSDLHSRYAYSQKGGQRLPPVIMGGGIHQSLLDEQQDWRTFPT